MQSKRIKVFDEIPYIDGKNIIIKKITDADADALAEMTADEDVYRYLPTFLFEKKYDDIHFVIKQMYDECFANKESVILGIYLKNGGAFCGIAEIYGVKDDIHKASIGCRLLKKYWGMGIASEMVAAVTGYLYECTDIQIITASSLAENRGSAKTLEKNGFVLVVSASDEDWGFDCPTKVDKWIK